jgi:hypothetical protein
MEQLGEVIGKDRLLLLGKFNYENDFKKYITNYSAFVEKSIFCNDKNFLKYINKIPIVFIIDKDYKIRLFYIPDYFPEFKETYFTKILPSYFLCKNINN